MSDLLWYRLGDNGDYHHVGNDIDALADVLNEANVEWDFDHTPGRIFSMEYAGNNYISAYWGDADSDMDRGLSESEVKELRACLRSKQ